MKNKFLILVSILSFSCKKENLGDCFKSTGKIVEEERSILPFNKLELNDRINLFITYAPELSLKVKAGKNLQDLIKTQVTENTLKIENTNKCNWVRSFKKGVDVFISTPMLKEITYYGSGEVHCLNTFETDTLLVNLWQASGDLTLNVDAQLVELKTHTGVGTIKCEGKTNRLVAFIGGNGFVDASQTIANEVLAVNENTGYVRVSATTSLKADIRGSGNIEYFGNPTITLSNEGSGKLIKIGN